MHNTRSHRGTPQTVRMAMWLSICLTLSCASPAIAGPASVDPQAGAIVRCDPSSVFGTADETVWIDLYVQDVAALYGIDVVATFDPAIASVVDQNPSETGVQIQPASTFLVPGYTLFQEADNAAGTIHYVTQLNPQEPATGSGPVVRVPFQSLSYGEFTMTFTLHMLADRNGAPIPSTAQTCAVEFGPPLAVQLADIAATPAGSSVVLSWETVAEWSHAGFNLYRAESESGPWSRLNDGLIPAATPGSTKGNEYDWTDVTVEPGTAYWYMLEDVALTGIATQHAPVCVTVAAPNALEVAAFGASTASPALPGVAALIVTMLAGARLCRMKRDENSSPRE